MEPSEERDRWDPPSAVQFLGLVRDVAADAAAQPDPDACLRRLRAGLLRLGFRLAEQHAGPIHAPLTDVVMSGIGRRQVAEELGRLYPSLKVIYMSGYTDDVIVRHGVIEEKVEFVQKPFSTRELSRRLRRLLDEAKQ